MPARAYNNMMAIAGAPGNPMMQGLPGQGVAYLENALEDLLPRIPMEMRGGIQEFDSYFTNFVTQAIDGNQNPPWLLGKAVSTFRTVEKMVKNIPACRPLLRHMYATTAQFFDPTEPAPI